MVSTISMCKSKLVNKRFYQLTSLFRRNETTLDAYEIMHLNTRYKIVTMEGKSETCIGLRVYLISSENGPREGH
jgi:hypothetical protein